MSHSQQAVDEPQGNEYMLLVVLASHKWQENAPEHTKHTLFV